MRNLMKKRMHLPKAWRWTLLAAACWTAPMEAGEPPVQFNRNIRPILSENCFTCHGPDASKRKAKLRLDQKAGALADLGGRFAIVPGKPDESTVFKRISQAAAKGLMPPAQTGKKLTSAQIAKVRLWIEQGAQWQDHWAFVAPVTPPIPEVKNKTWPRNVVDHFILARLEQEGLQPSPEASRETLVRRLTLDLTGLPPTPAEVDQFLADRAPDAYDRWVERLLRSPRYGEHLARFWLDGARYGDTHGLHLDNERSIWPYRDWVVKAFNENQPFDRFTVEQLAGDLLPAPTRDQLVATGFIRCNVTTSEGGAIPEEFAARYAVDRAETMSTVWMGLTAGCAVCHDHKYDPLPQREFYQLYAFFNNLDEDPMDGNALLPPPVVKLSSPQQEQQLAAYARQIENVERVIRAGVAAVEYQDAFTPQEARNLAPTEFIWIDDSLPEGAQPSKDESAWNFTMGGSHPVYSGGCAHTQTTEKTAQHFFTEARHPLRVGKGDKLFAYVYLDPLNPPKAVMLQFNSDGWDHRAFWGEDLIEMGKTNSPGRFPAGSMPEAGRWIRLEVDASQVGLAPGAMVNGWAFTQHGGTVYWDRAGLVSRLPQARQPFESLAVWDQWQREMNTPSVPDPVRQAIKQEPAKRSAEQQKQIREHFLEHIYAGTRPVFDPLHEKVAGLRRERDQLDASIPRSLITRELKQPRASHILIRGAYDNKGGQVFPEVPSILPRLPQGAPRNRLGLAQWLVDPQHPLTARVAVNRFWHNHFGVGLVKTTENFGSQGEPPSHIELLDWLAADFVASGWDVKHLHRLLVTSAAYRQSSRVRPELQDPENRLLAHGPRYRLDAEVIRDSVLAVSGLMVEKQGGRGVRPYQPEGIWEAVAYPTSTTAKYQADSGEALYRRSLYTFWKRTAPPPSLVTFDAPSRESCRVRRERTNTPLQALALLNDIQYVEAALKLAQRIWREGGGTLDQRLAFGFRLVTARHPDPRECEILRSLYQANLAEYQQHGESARKLLQSPGGAWDETIPAPELAAWTLVANAMLNLSETITNN